MPKKDNSEENKKKKTTKKKVTKKRDGRKKPVDEPYGADFVEIANEVVSIAPKTGSNAGLVPVEKAEKIAQAKYQELILENGKDLEPIERFVAEQLAMGKTEEEISTKYGLGMNEIQVMKQNPLFVQEKNKLILSTGMTTKIERIATSKLLLEKIADAMKEKIVSDEALNELKITQLHQLWMAEGGNMSKLMNEDQKKNVNVDINVQLTKHLENRNGKPIDIKSYDPTDDFPIFDAEIIEDE